MEPEETSEFCKHLAVLIIDDVHRYPCIQRYGVANLFGMLRSPEWRKHVVARFWTILAPCTLVGEEEEPSKWRLWNGMELLEFARGLSDGEGSKWWYGMLWFHHDKLDTMVRDEVERIASDRSLGDGLLDLN